MSNNPELDALVVRNIGDILAAKKHVEDNLDPRLWSEVGQAVADSIIDPAWIVRSDPEEHEIWIYHRSCQNQDAPEQIGSFYFELDERLSATGFGDDTWLAPFLGNSPNGSTVAFWLVQDFGKQPWKKLIKSNVELIDKLRSAGLAVDEKDDRRLCVPFVLDSNALALAFETEEFQEATRPVVEAIKVIIGAWPDLEELRKQALDKA